MLDRSRLLPSESVPEWGSDPLETLQITEKRTQFIRFKWVRRHTNTGLDALRICDPTAKVTSNVGQGSGRDCAAALQMCQIGADPSPRRCSPYRVTHHTRMAKEYLLSLTLLICLRLDCRFDLVAVPGIVLVLRLGHDDESHVSMLETAELSALSSEDSWLVDTER